MVPGSTLMYGSNFCSDTFSPRAFSRRPSEAAVMPLPSDETTPPVTNTYLTCLLTYAPAFPRVTGPGTASYASTGTARIGAVASDPRPDHQGISPTRAAVARGHTPRMSTETKAQHGALFWFGMTLLAVWNVGLFVLAMASKQSYDSCMADDGFLCFDFSGPILAVMFGADMIVALIAVLVTWVR